MTKTTLAIESPGSERRVANHEAITQEWDHAVSCALASIVTDAWMLANYYSFLHHVIVESIVCSNVEVIAAVTCALEPTDAENNFEKKWDDSVKNVEAPSVGDLLASDQRSIACKTLGGAFESNLTKSLRRDLILASSVVC